MYDREYFYIYLDGRRPGALNTNYLFLLCSYFKVVHWVGLEPTALGLENRYSIQLSYQCIKVVSILACFSKSKPAVSLYLMLYTTRLIRACTIAFAH